MEPGSASGFFISLGLAARPYAYALPRVLSATVGLAPSAPRRARPAARVRRSGCGAS
jgi:hypothetical protein